MNPADWNRDSLSCLTAIAVGAYTKSFFKGLAAGLVVEYLAKNMGIAQDLPNQLAPATQGLASLLVNWARRED